MKILNVLGVGVLSVSGLWFVAGRPLSNLFSYFTAGAETTVQGIERQIPDSVKDQRMQDQFRMEHNNLVDQKVKIDLAKNKLFELEEEMWAMEDKVEDGALALRLCHSTLISAKENGDESIEFDGKQYELEVFEGLVDDLLDKQENAEQILAAQYGSYDNMLATIEASQTQVNELERALQMKETEFASLVERRELADMEKDILESYDEIKVVNTGMSTNADLKRMKDEVTESEVSNRTMARHFTKNQDSNPLTESTRRMSRLEQYSTATEEPAAETAPAAPAADADEELLDEVADL